MPDTQIVVHTAADASVDPGAKGTNRRMQLARFAGIGAVLLLGAVFVYANRAEVPNALKAARGANPLFLGAAAALTAAYVLNFAMFHAAAYRAVRLEIPLRDMTWLTLGSSFLNMVAKSGGMGGLTLFLADSQKRGQARGKVITAYVLSALLGHLAFALLLGVTLIVVWLDGRLSRAEVIAGGIFTIYLGAQVALFIAGVRSRSALRYVHALPARLFAGLKRALGQKAEPPEADHEAADELYDAISILIRHPRRIIVPATHALLVELFGVLTIWAVLAAFGQNVGIQVPLVAYGMSVLFSIVGFLPAGIGFAEASLAAVFTSFGVAGPVAAVAVLTYRVFEVWIPFAVGAYAAQHTARRELP